jgi:hypothetical protein
MLAVPANPGVRGRRKIGEKGSCPFDSKAAENLVYTQFDGMLEIYSEMRPIPDILAGNQLGPRLSTQIQERNGRALLF